jgi:hypothetical protein
MSRKRGGRVVGGTGEPIEHLIEVTIQRHAAVDLATKDAVHREVAVRVDEAGRERATVQVGDSRGGDAPELAAAPDCGDAAIAHRQGVGAVRPRPQRRADEDEVGLHAAKRRLRRAAPSGRARAPPRR